MIVGSLLLHLIRFTLSLLFGKPSSSSRTFKRRRRAAQGREPMAAELPLAIYEDALDRVIGTDDDDDEEFAEFVNAHEQLAEEGEEYGDVGGFWQKVGDVDYFLNEVDGVDMDVGGAKKVLGDKGESELNASESDAGDGIEELGDSLQEVGDDPGEIRWRVSEAGEEEVGDSQRLISQGSLGLPSDLPPSLDNVIIAAAVNNHGGHAEEGSEQHVLNMAAGAAGRPLAPTFSSVAAALQESSASSTRKPASQAGTGRAAAALPTRTSSYDRFVSRFNEHFLLDGDHHQE